jgi:hypothetical protein
LAGGCVLAAGRVVTAIKAAKVVRDTVQVVEDGLGLILQSLGVWAHVKAFDREVNVGIVLLLPGNLRIHVSKHAGAASVGSSSRLEAFKLDAHDLGHGVYFELLSDVAVLPAYVAIPLVVATERLLLRVASEAGVKVEGVAAALVLSRVTIKSSVSRLKLAEAEGAILAAFEDDSED